MHCAHTHTHYIYTRDSRGARHHLGHSQKRPSSSEFASGNQTDQPLGRRTMSKPRGCKRGEREVRAKTYFKWYCIYSTGQQGGSSCVNPEYIYQNYLERKLNLFVLKSHKQENRKHVHWTLKQYF